MDYKNSLNRNKRIDLINKNYYMLGVIAINEEDYPPIGLIKDVVTKKDIHNSEIIFYIKSISTEPSLFLELGLDNDLFVGFSSHSLSKFQNKIMDDKFNFVDDDERVKIIKNKLSIKAMGLSGK
jgi:hypothetical protein